RAQRTGRRRTPWGGFADGRGSSCRCEPTTNVNPVNGPTAWPGKQDPPMNTFADLGVPSFVCDALARRGITHPFEIQAATIADALAGRDVCGRAPTGSGKTLAFGVPLVASLADG